MSYNIAVAGKGGTGKTSLTGLLIDILLKEKKKPILSWVIVLQVLMQRRPQGRCFIKKWSRSA